jgi:hypothetical protein
LLNLNKNCTRYTDFVRLHVKKFTLVTEITTASADCAGHLIEITTASVDCAGHLILVPKG